MSSAGATAAVSVGGAADVGVEATGVSSGCAAGASAEAVAGVIVDDAARTIVAATEHVTVVSAASVTVEGAASATIEGAASATIEGAASGGAPALSIRALRRRYRDGKAGLLDSFTGRRATPVAAARLVRSLCRLVDQTLQALWDRAALPTGAALVAVGGYGRGELFPHSDVDVLVLLPQRTGPAAALLEQAVEAFIAACWDVGMDIGSSVRSVGECADEAAGDVTVQTALLEARLLRGDPALYASFRAVFDAAMDPRAFLRAKSLEAQQRHQKFENTPYALEPNCKESPGGLRDLQTVTWVTQAAGLGTTWQQMAATGLATAFEVQQLVRNEALLTLIRCGLHIAAGRREDRLVFDLQTAVAERFGYRARVGQRSSEALMRRYYWAAKAVVQLTQVLMLNIEERVYASQDAPMRPITPKFLERGGMLEVVSDDLYQRDPHAILETFYVYQTTVGPKGLSARTLRALYNARHLMDAAFRRDPANRAMFMRILTAPEGQTHTLRLMNDTSVLGRYLWVFRRIVGQMQHDLFHVYTVDQHILMVLRNVRRFFVPEHAHEYPFCTRLALTWDQPYLLYVAALFHDVAKGRGGDHSDLGAVEVRRFCRHHAIDAAGTELVVFLVQAHLTMSRFAQKEDLSDLDVIRAFAEIVGTERRLTALYLLTVADIRGTSPRVWNAWKGKLLEDLYRATLRQLGGARPNADAEIDARKQDALRDLAVHALSVHGGEPPLWQTLDISYFARHDAADIAWHARALQDKVDSTAPVVRARISPVGEGLQVLVYALDRPDLFARICGYFEGAAFNILDARIHTTRAGYALDTFQVISPQHERSGDGQSRYRDLIYLVETQLYAAVDKTGPLPEPGRGRLSRRVRSFPITPRVTLRPDERGMSWLLSVSTSDRSGLLYAIARVLAQHGINLQLAKITTLGERAEDTFLIDGAALQQNKGQIRMETELLDAIAA